MKNELAIQKYLKAHGIEKTVADFSLMLRETHDLILLKYDQIESYAHRGTEEVKDCRGIILDKKTFEVKSLAFRRFFNLGEEVAADIDWSTAKIFSKLDGSLIQVYYHNGWEVATSGTIDARTSVNNLDFTFRDLFIRTVESQTGMTWNQFTSNLYINNCYAFELCTPYNIVVTPHKTSFVVLLGARNLNTLYEYGLNDLFAISDTLKVKVPKVYGFGSVEAILEGLKLLPYDDEGYVVCDANFNRIKIKNPAYVAIHHLKGKLGAHNILELIKSNEVDEFISTFPEREEEILELQSAYENLIHTLDIEASELLSKEYVERKDYALTVLNHCSTGSKTAFAKGFFFSMYDKKITSAREWINNFDNSNLYKLLTKNKS